MSGQSDVAIGGGVESMSRVPMGTDGGAWAIDPQVAWQQYFVPQGVSADLIATLDGHSREQVDAYAVESQRRAAHAQQSGWFDRVDHPGQATAAGRSRSHATSICVPARRSPTSRS